MVAVVVAASELEPGIQKRHSWAVAVAVAGTVKHLDGCQSFDWTGLIGLESCSCHRTPFAAAAVRTFGAVEATFQIVAAFASSVTNSLSF